MTYKEMTQRTAKVMHKHRTFYDIPLLTINLSRLWVTLITGAPKKLAPAYYIMPPIPPKPIYHS
ncbi:hypothetical protein [Paenibacillus sp. sgz500992]|uniref:hypothetical protein n=1 Tax=Paenibacillus sp. sgz500992 TaxID=3242476 RepID=UPI0036D213EC